MKEKKKLYSYRLLYVVKLEGTSLSIRDIASIITKHKEVNVVIAGNKIQRKDLQKEDEEEEKIKEMQGE